MNYKKLKDRSAITTARSRLFPFFIKLIIFLRIYSKIITHLLIQSGNNLL